MRTMAKEMPHQIFLVPEILEAILLQLPIQDLLVTAQRVSHAWTTAIESSAALQQALFFQPSPTHSSPQQPWSFNPLLRRAFPPWFRTTHDICKGAKVVASLSWASSPEAQAAFMRADASWRNMLPLQPAKKVLEVVGKKNIREGIFEINGRVRFEGGVRMGYLYDLGFEVVRKPPASSFWILWDEAKEEQAASEGGGETEECKEREGKEKATIFTEHSWFKCGPGMPPAVGDEFRSEAFEESAISIREERRSMHWHGGFGNPPNGGWQLI